MTSNRRSPGSGVEVGSGLVREHERRFADYRTSHCHSLLLSAPESFPGLRFSRPSSPI